MAEGVSLGYLSRRLGIMPDRCIGAVFVVRESVGLGMALGAALGIDLAVAALNSFAWVRLGAIKRKLSCTSSATKFQSTGPLTSMLTQP